VIEYIALFAIACLYLAVSDKLFEIGGRFK